MIESVNDACPLERSDRKEVYEVGFVVPPSDAGAQPFAMVVKLVDTIATVMAMEGPLWPKDQTSVAILEPRQVKTTVSHYKLVHLSSLVFPSCNLKVLLCASSQ